MGKFKASVIEKFIENATAKFASGVAEPICTCAPAHLETAKMRDGVDLSACIYEPVEKGDYPIILCRSPYPNSDYQKLTLKTFVKYGFIVVYQDTRGKGNSGGEWQPFENERNDGIDTVKWLKTTSFYSGKIVLAGYSYQGYCALSFSDEWDEDIKTAVILNYAGNLYDFAYVGGNFREEFFATWNLQNNGIKQFDGDDAIQKFRRYENFLPRKDILDKAVGNSVKFYKDIVSAPESANELWKKYELPSALSIKVPVFLSTGWYDYTVKGMIELYKNLGSREKSALFIGPWTHSGINSGDKETPNIYKDGIMGYTNALKWLMSSFYGAKNELSGIKYYTFNHNDYEIMEDYPKTKQIEMFLFSGESKLSGIINPSVIVGAVADNLTYAEQESTAYKENELEEEDIVEFDFDTEKDLTDAFNENQNTALELGGDLSFDDERSEKNILCFTKTALTMQGAQSCKTFTYNPKEPTLTLGGSSAAVMLVANKKKDKQCCALQRIKNDGKSLYFESEPLLTDMNLLSGRLCLRVSSTVNDTSFTAKLCAVENKKCYAFSYGITTLKNNGKEITPYNANEEKEIEINLSPVSYLAKAGSKIALIIASSDYPSFARHLNNDEPWASSVTYQRAYQTVYFEMSRLMLEVKDN